MLVKRGSRFQGLTPEGEQVLVWARRIVGDAARCAKRCALRATGFLDVSASPRSRPRSPWCRGSPRRFATSTPASTFRYCHALRSRSCRSWEITTSTPVSPTSTTSRWATSSVCRSIRSAISSSRRREPVCRTRQGQLGRGGEAAALPAHARHAEPPHHRPAPRRGRNDGPTDARIQFHDRAVLAHPYRQMVIDHAAQSRRDIRLCRADPGDPYRRTGCQPHRRPCRGPPRTAHAARLGVAERGDDAGSDFAETYWAKYA